MLRDRPLPRCGPVGAGAGGASGEQDPWAHALVAGYLGPCESGELGAAVVVVRGGQAD